MPASDDNPSILLENRAAPLLAEGKIDEALAAAAETVASSRAATKDDGQRFTPMLVEALKQQAETQRDASKISESVASFIEALDLAEKSDVSLDKRAAMRVALATTLDFNGREPEALLVYEQAIKELEGLEPPDLATIGQLRNNVALTYKRQGKFAMAEQHYLRAVEALENTTGTETEEYAALYNNLGSLYYAAGFPDQAGEVFGTALKLREKLFGENHPDVAQSHCNMGAVQHEQGDDAAAQQSFEKCLTILEGHLPAKAESYEAAGNDYVALLGSIGEDAKAAEIQRRLIKALEV